MSAVFVVAVVVTVVVLVTAVAVVVDGTRPYIGRRPAPVTVDRDALTAGGGERS
ncbi:hypothetical protein [Mycolicibacterium sp.]|uniref:hypothetical protein n=1 Tax=Mycolicibacterium sp. TaxID=2320850 RepID=UPI00355FB346